MIREGRDGHLVELYDRETMARRILELLDDPEKLKKMSRRCHRRMLEKYSWKVIAGHTERLFREVIADPENKEERCSVGAPCVIGGE